MCRHTRSGQFVGSYVPGTPEAGEDLPPDRVVPVAERAPAGDLVGAEGAAAQHLVLRSEEDLGIFAVRERGETGGRIEVAGRPLPHVTDELVHAQRRRAVGIGTYRRRSQ